MKKQEKGFFWIVTVEMVIPCAIFLFLIAPNFMDPVWQNVKSDATTPGYVTMTMHMLSIAIVFCWLKAYNYFRRGLFEKPKKS